MVLGSSTAAGAGASTSDSAWVNRYRHFLQEINPKNQVTNLAQGGYNTYRIMPSNFLAPPGRPSVDTLKNITRAVSLNPHAIILNLPSNDVASGFTVPEQLYNMDSIFRTAGQAGIPIWICTTQPRNFSNTTYLQRQFDMKDSIIAHFAPFYIDFWSGMATNTYALDSTFDSGDGVHLNDLGHRTLFNRAKATNILGYLFQSSPSPDILITSIENQGTSSCGDTNAIFEISFANIGTASSLPAWLHFEVMNGGGQSIFLDSILTDTLNSSCTVLMESFGWNSSVAGDYLIQSWVQNIEDSFPSNDSASISVRSIGRPWIQTHGDTLCQADTGIFKANKSLIDNVLWYSALSSVDPVFIGSEIKIPNLNKDSSLFAQSVRGSLVYNEELFTRNSSNINWNGTMFDLMSSDSLVIDSLDLKIADSGLQVVEIWTKTGSYVGFEHNSGPWTLWATDTILVSNVEEFLTMNFPPLIMNSGDTLGLYLQLADPSARLSYHWIASPQSRSTPELEIRTGSGISHNFSGLFHPRDWNGRVYYHHGFRTEGECATKRVLVEVEFSDQALDLGVDTAIAHWDSLFLDPGVGFSNFQWSTGASSQGIWIIGPNLPLGPHTFSLTALDSLNCIKQDSITIFIGGLGLGDWTRDQFEVFPNPNNGQFSIRFHNQLSENYSIRIHDSKGRIVFEEKVVNDADEKWIDLSSLAGGVYYIVVRTKSRSFSEPLVVIR